MGEFAGVGFSRTLEGVNCVHGEESESDRRTISNMDSTPGPDRAMFVAPGSLVLSSTGKPRPMGYVVKILSQSRFFRNGITVAMIKVATLVMHVRWSKAYLLHASVHWLGFRHRKNPPPTFRLHHFWPRKP